jgi:hypothetical protein
MEIFNKDVAIFGELSLTNRPNSQGDVVTVSGTGVVSKRTYAEIKSDLGDTTAQEVTLDDTNLVVAPSTNLQTFAELADKALLKARDTGISTSYVSTVAIGGTTFSQPEFTGQIRSSEGYFAIDYEGDSNVTVNNLNSNSTYVYVDKEGVLQQQTTIPTREDWTRKLFTMRITVNVVNSEITGFEYLSNPIGHYASSIRDVYSFLLAQGVPFKKDQIITGRTDNLGFNVSAGSLLEFGGTGDIYNPNIKYFDPIYNADFFLVERTTFDLGGNTNIPKYWDNNGVLTAIGSTTLVGHRLYRFSNGELYMQYGQGNYANINLAKAGVLKEEYVLNNLLKKATFMGWWFIESTATKTAETVNAAFVEYTIGVQGGSSSELSGALIKGNNLSDVLDTAISRVNLGLDTTANQTDSTDKRFMTDAQENLLDNMVIESSQISDFEELRTYIHTQPTASSTWIISHPLKKYPTPTVVDSGKNKVKGEVRYIDINTVELKFTASFSGYAYLN